MGALRTCFFIFAIFLTRTSFAQEADTTRIPVETDSLIVSDSTQVPDSLITAQARRDSVRLARTLLPAVPFLDAFPGTVTGDTLPIRHMSLDAQGMLEEVPGGFVYDFGASGWPDGWSPFGLSPNTPTLSFNSIPFSNPTSGLPSYDLLPFTMLQQIKVQPVQFGSTPGVNTRLRSFDAARPLTEISYRSSNNGLQSVLVSHSQRRRLHIAGWPGHIHLLLAYGGHGANGEYAGSKLEGARQLVSRIRINNALGSLEILNLNNRRRLGAHAGVIPGTGSDFINIYNRFNARVINSAAQRQKIRNDLSITLQRPLLSPDSSPFTATGYWTANTFRYVDGDTLQARTHTLGYKLSQKFPFTSGAVSLHLDGFRHQVREGSRDTSSTASALPDSLGLTRSYLQAYARLHVNSGNLDIELTPGFYSNTHSSTPGGSLKAAYSLGILRFFVTASRAQADVPLIAEYGWGPTLIPLENVPSPKTNLFRGGISLKWNVFDFSVSAFTHESSNSIDYMMNASLDTLHVRSLNEPVSWNGFAAQLGFRRLAQRGFYLTASATQFQFNSPVNNATYSSLSQSLPEFLIHGRIGLRYRIFQGDLDFDLYTRGKLWSSFLGRTLHPQTGLLVLRDTAARQVDSSATLDVMLEAKVRTAKFFIGFENLLSGTTVITGNMLVPDYPLPQRRFRFGVFWPIWN